MGPRERRGGTCERFRKNFTGFDMGSGTKEKKFKLPEVLNLNDCG